MEGSENIPVTVGGMSAATAAETTANSNNGRSASADLITKNNIIKAKSDEKIPIKSHTEV